MNNRDMEGGQEAGVGKESEIYMRRFSRRETEARNLAWSVLVPEFLQQYVNPTDTVVDIGAGDGQFITRIAAGRKVAVDLDPQVRELGRHGIEVLQISATSLRDHFTGQADVIFVSNFLEHLPNKRAVLKVLEECHRILKPAGAIVILQPNIRYVGVAYWDYIDHHIALTEQSLMEALDITGFEVKLLVPRFLPYTARSRLGNFVGSRGTKLLIRLYLRNRLIWRLFGKQTLIMATRRPANERPIDD